VWRGGGGDNALTRGRDNLAEREVERTRVREMPRPRGEKATSGKLPSSPFYDRLACTNAFVRQFRSRTTTRRRRHGSSFIPSAPVVDAKTLKLRSIPKTKRTPRELFIRPTFDRSNGMGDGKRRRTTNCLRPGVSLNNVSG